MARLAYRIDVHVPRKALCRLVDIPVFQQLQALFWGREGHTDESPLWLEQPSQRQDKMTEQLVEREGEVRQRMYHLRMLTLGMSYTNAKAV